MLWNKNLSNLRNVLAGLYWNTDDAHRIVLDVGMKPAFIRFDNKSINTWQSILEQAQYHGKVDAIIAKAQEEYPDIQSLALAKRDQLLVVELPQIDETEWRGPEDSDQLERIIGAQSTLLPISFLESGLQLSRAISRIELADGSRGTGFLAENNLLITNSHVISSEGEAQKAKVQFNFQQTVQGRDAQIDEYSLVPTDGFAISPPQKQGGDDWTAVRVQGNPNENWGAIRLAHAEPRVRDRAIIIQHPGGGYKQIAFYHNVIVAVNDKRIQYLTDTLEGSSGSPVFGSDWQLIAVHHKGGQYEPNSKRNRWRNQGIHINVVIDGLIQAGLYTP